MVDMITSSLFTVYCWRVPCVRCVRAVRGLVNVGGFDEYLVRGAHTSSSLGTATTAVRDCNGLPLLSSRL
jgi:hypothetical protein